MEEAFKAKRMEEAFNRHDIEAVTKRMEEAYNKHDAAAWSAFYTEFAIDVWSPSSESVAVGLAAIKRKYEAYFASHHPKPISFKVAQVYTIANKVYAVIDYTDQHGVKGHALVVYVYVPDADDWKVRLNYQL
jgi:ketosteroid isomerase-like protein